MLTLSGLYNAVCRVFNPGMIRHHNPIIHVKNLIGLNDEDFNYTKTEIDNTQLFINQTNIIPLSYLPFNLNGKECIFINLPIIDNTQALDIVYTNIGRRMEKVFYYLVTRFFPHENHTIRRLYAWMAAYKISERFSMNIDNFDDIVKTTILSTMCRRNLKYIMSSDLIPHTIFSDGNGDICNIDSFVKLVNNDTTDLFDYYLFTNIFEGDYRIREW